MPPSLRLAALLLAATAFAEDGTRLIPPIPIITVPPATAAPVFDGNLDDDCWKAAARITTLHASLNADLTEKDPSAAGEALATEILLTWRPDALLIAFRCKDARIIASPDRKRDDKLHLEDVAEVFLDPFGDGLRYWEFQVSPTSACLDALHVLTGEPTPAPNGRLGKEFNFRHHLCFISEDLPTLAVGAMRTDTGWNAEISIPPAVLGRQASGTAAFAPGLMRLNLVRYDWEAPSEDSKRQLRQASWSTFEHGCPHLSAARMGWISLSAK